MYEILTDGSGEITFTLVGNVVPGPAHRDADPQLPGGCRPAPGWRPWSVASGDGAGLTQTECWDATFAATYNDKPWSTSEDFGDVSPCPVLPSFQ